MLSKSQVRLWFYFSAYHRELLEDLLSLTVLSKSTAAIVFAEKLYGIFALQKLLTFLVAFL